MSYYTKLYARHKDEEDYLDNFILEFASEPGYVYGIRTVTTMNTFIKEHNLQEQAGLVIHNLQLEEAGYQSIKDYSSDMFWTVGCEL
jgi:hypothetical protein